jgi:uncharacterized protein YpuA (DUF1002 family)
MKKLIVGVILILIILSPLYAVSGFSVTIGETTNNNPTYKNTMLNYFQSNSDKNISNATVKVITAAEVNNISKNVTGRVYNSNQIFSCALVDLSYTGGINVLVDKSKITVVTPQMYVNALKSTGIDTGYVVVSSPVTATGESALAGVLKSYELAVGTPIPEEAKQAATEEMVLEMNLTNQTNQSADQISTMMSEIQNQTQAQNLQDPAQIKVIVIDVANQMNINLTDNQTQQIADTIANSQKLQGNLTDFKQQLQNVSQQTTQNTDLLNQIISFFQGILNYLQGTSGQ